MWNSGFLGISGKHSTSFSSCNLCSSPKPCSQVPVRSWLLKPSLIAFLLHPKCLLALALLGLASSCITLEIVNRGLPWGWCGCHHAADDNHQEASKQGLTPLGLGFPVFSASYFCSAVQTLVHPSVPFRPSSSVCAGALINADLVKTEGQPLLQ